MEKVGTPCGRTENAVPAQDQNLLAIKGRILGDCVLLILGALFYRENGIGRASRNASSTVHAVLGIDVHLCLSLPLWLVRLGMNGIAGAGLYTELIFHAGISDYIGHECLFSSSLGRFHHHVPTHPQ